MNKRDIGLLKIWEKHPYSLTLKEVYDSQELVMSEPEVEWYVNRIKVMLGEIDTLVLTGDLTNSKREIISHNTNEIEINLHIIMRKLKEMR